MNKTYKLIGLLATGALSQHALADTEYEMDNRVYVKGGYVQYQLKNSPLGKQSIKGYTVTVGDRISLDDKQSIIVETSFTQTPKVKMNAFGGALKPMGSELKPSGKELKPFDVQLRELSAKVNYERAFQVKEKAFLIPTVGVGYQETRLTASKAKQSVKNFYGEVGLKGQATIKSVSIVPEVAYQKSFKTVASQGLLPVTNKKADGMRGQITFYKELEEEDSALMLSVGVEKQLVPLSNEKVNKFSIQTGVMF